MTGVLLILIAAGVIFLAMLGKHGWSPFMRVLIVLAVVPIALLFVYLGRTSPESPRSPFRAHWPAPVATVDTTQTNRDGVVLVEQSGEVQLAGLDRGSARAPIRSQMMPDSAPGFFDIQAQIRPPFVRGRWSVLFIFVVFGLFGFVILTVSRQVRRGAWTWPGVMRVGAIAAGICLLLMIGASWVSREQSRNQAQLEARRAATEIRWLMDEGPRVEPLPPPEMAPDAKEPGRDRDVEVWRRESVLGFVPSSPVQMPDWCREGLETEPGTALPDGRDWIAGYSSQNPEIGAAEAEAVAAARRKLALAALRQVKKAVPELDVRQLEDLGSWLAKRHGLRVQEMYREKATLARQQRPYGSVYRVAVRIAADSSTVDALARRICQHIDRYGTGEPDVRAAFFSAIIVVVLAFSAFLLYVFISAGSAGRWGYPLRVVSGGMLVAIVTAVIYIFRSLGAS